MANVYRSWRTGIQIDNIYPIGSIYISFSSTNPGSLFGGTWEQMNEDKLLMCAGSTYTANSTGGSATKILSTANLPSHTHSIAEHTHTLGNHTHTLNNHTHDLSNHTHGLANHTHTLSGHSHGTGHSSNINFVISNGDIALNSTSRAWAATTNSNGIFFVYTSAAVTHGINEYHNTGGPSNNSSGGPSNNTSTGPSNNTSAGPSNNTTGGPSTTNVGDFSAFDTGSTGSNTAWDIMPPYIGVYVWKRTA